MLSRSLTLLAFALSLGGFSGCSSPPATDGADSAQSAQITAIKGLFPVLTVGMTSEAVRRKLGKPAEIEPMESPKGKAEVWVYHFEQSVGMTQVATGTRDIPAFGISATGPGGTTTVQEMVYTPVEQMSLVTLRLLMFNGRLTAQKAQVENSLKYR